MLFFCLTRPHRIKEVLLVRSYRKLYAKGVNHSKRCSGLSKKYNFDISRVENIIQKWMIDNPLRYIKIFRDKDLLQILINLKKQGCKIIIYSDYPVTKKLEALDFTADAMYSADDVGCLKPSPDGLLKICTENELVISECLFIGDRYEKDGKCAENTGMEYTILPQRKRARQRVVTYLASLFLLSLL